MTISSLDQTLTNAEIFQSLNPVEEVVANRNKSVDELGSAEFLELMIAQLENQDPTEPMDPSKFMNDLANFSMVGGIQELNTAFSDLTATLTGQQATQAAGLVGRSVSTGSATGTSRYIGTTTEGEDVYGSQASVEMPLGSQGGTYYVQDAAGQLVYTGTIPAGGGTQLIQWAGVDFDGNVLPPGDYRFAAESLNGGQPSPAQVSAHQQVVSVSIGAGGALTLNLANGSALAAADVKEFY